MQDRPDTPSVRTFTQLGEFEERDHTTGPTLKAPVREALTLSPPLATLLDTTLLPQFLAYDYSLEHTDTLPFITARLPGPLLAE